MNLLVIADGIPVLTPLPLCPVYHILDKIKSHTRLCMAFYLNDPMNQ